MAAPVKVSLPRIDTKLVNPETGEIDNEWYLYLEQLLLRTGGDVDTIGDTVTKLQDVSDRTDAQGEAISDLQDVELVAGDGLEGGGKLSGRVSISLKYNPGWTPATGSGSKGAYSQYNPTLASATYDPLEINALSLALAEVSARLVAIEKALWAIEALRE